MMIDWSKLRGDPQKSFERFCYVLARLLYRNIGRFTNIDDSGGGDGVEFYLKTNGGKEWGWQAKFFFPYKRLKYSNRKTQMIKSLNRALEVHPNLEKFYICTPCEFTPDEHKWIEEKFKSIIPNNKKIEIFHWHEGEFDSIIFKPEYLGLREYFFGDFELDFNFFSKYFMKVRGIVGKKYLPETHLTSYEEQAILKNIDKDILSEYEDIFENLVEFCSNLVIPIKNRDFIEEEFESYINTLRNFNETIPILRDEFHNLSLDFQTGSFFNTYKYKLNQEIILPYLLDLDELIEAFENQDIIQKLGEFISFFYRLMSLIKGLTSKTIEFIGKAGFGKTQITCHICDSFIKSNKPGILLLGRHFDSTEPLETQILKILGLENIPWTSFINLLKILSITYNCRIPLIIDGINESIANGRFNRVWKDHLAGFMKTLEVSPEVFLIISYRPSYLKMIFKEEHTKPERSIRLEGFYDVAIEKYFEFYNIKVNLIWKSYYLFKNPLFIRIFCETQSQKSNGSSNIVITEVNLMDVFRKFISNINSDLLLKHDKPPNFPLIYKCLERISEKLWERNTRSLTFDEFVNLVEGKKIEDIKWEKSLSRDLLEEGLLINRDSFESQEYIFFTYDSIAGFLIASMLIHKIQNKLTIKNITKLIKKKLDFSKNIRHPLFIDILSNLSLLLLEKKITLIDFSKLSIEREFLIAPILQTSKEFLNQKLVDYVDKEFNYILSNGNLVFLLFPLLVRPSHPLNISFFSDKLSNLRMNTRDVLWTELIRKNIDLFNSILSVFNRNIKNEEFRRNCFDELELYFHFLIWTLTTTIRKFRNDVTEALFLYGINYPEVFFKYLKKMLVINDPYINERMLAAVYGVSLFFHNHLDSKQFDGILKIWGLDLYDMMFKKDAKYSTTHFFTRHYTRMVIELSIIHNSDLSEKINFELIKPPYNSGGIREWGIIDLEDLGQFQPGAYPFKSLNFGNYIIGGLVKNRVNHDYESKEYKEVIGNVYWRMRNMGYSAEKFSEIDANIYRFNTYRNRVEKLGKIDRYGKKYAWISYFELAGYRDDLNLIKKWDENRLSQYHIDPSFPLKLKKVEFNNRNLIYDCSIDLKMWLNEFTNFIFSKLLMREELINNKAQWIAMSGLIYQNSSDYNQQTVIRIESGIFLNSENNFSIKNLIDYLKDHNVANNKVGIIFAGEIPWSPIYQDFQEEGKLLSLTNRYFVEVETDIDSEIDIPTKDLSVFLKLIKNGRNFEYFDNDGKKGIITCKPSSSNDLKGDLIYIRTDLLKKYALLKKGYFFQKIRVVFTYLPRKTQELHFNSNNFRDSKQRSFEFIVIPSEINKNSETIVKYLSKRKKSNVKILKKITNQRMIKNDLERN